MTIIDNQSLDPSIYFNKETDCLITGHSNINSVRQSWIYRIAQIISPNFDIFSFKRKVR